jgi:hypothetical protein
MIKYKKFRQMLLIDSSEISRDLYIKVKNKIEKDNKLEEE